MGGPSVKRENVNTAPIAGMRDPTQEFLMALLTGRGPGTQGTQGPRSAKFPNGVPGGQQVPGADLGLGNDFLSRVNSLLGTGPSALQRQVGGTFSQLVGGQTASERAFNVALPQIQEQLTGIPGMDVVNAANPIFQQNLGDALSRQRQFGGPRFAAESGRQSRELEQRSLQDFNLFQQQVMEAGRQRQLQAAGVLGGLGGGADTSRLGLMQGAGGFALAEQQAMMPLLQMLLGSIFTAGGVNASPVVTQNPGFFQNLMQAAGTVAAFIPGGGGAPSAPPSTSVQGTAGWPTMGSGFQGWGAP